MKHSSSLPKLIEVPAINMLWIVEEQHLHFLSGLSMVSPALICEISIVYRLKPTNYSKRLYYFLVIYSIFFLSFLNSHYSPFIFVLLFSTKCRNQLNLHHFSYSSLYVCVCVCLCNVLIAIKCVFVFVVLHVID